MFTSIITAGSLTITEALICSGTSLVMGFLISIVFMIKGTYTKNFAITLALMPIIVQVMIMMVNGNLGTAVAILGVFSLVRFRSRPGDSMEILAVMMAMAVGLATGMGFVTFAILLTVIICLVWLILFKTPFGEKRKIEKELKITIPENLDYNGIFDDIFKEYTSKVSLQRVRTTNMGSLYELCFYITVKDPGKEKEMIDAIRCKNGNLPVVCGMVPVKFEEL